MICAFMRVPRSCECRVMITKGRTLGGLSRSGSEEFFHQCHNREVGVIDGDIEFPAIFIVAHHPRDLIADCSLNCGVSEIESGISHRAACCEISLFIPGLLGALAEKINKPFFQDLW